MSSAAALESELEYLIPVINRIIDTVGRRSNLVRDALSKHLGGISHKKTNALLTAMVDSGYLYRVHHKNRMWYAVAERDGAICLGQLIED